MSLADAGESSPAEPTGERLPVRSDTDVVAVRRRVRQLAEEQGLSLVETTKLVTAASEIARNTLRHGGGGEATIGVERQLGGELAICLTFVDEGPGIADLTQAMQDGFTTLDGLGLGLSGAARLVSDLVVSARQTGGTCVRLVQTLSARRNGARR